MQPYVADADFTLYVGDALDVLRELPDASVDCCVTSPPYWGLRDYGTGSWEGGDPDCDHKRVERTMHAGRQGNAYGTPPGAGRMGDEYYADVCGKCGARRVDRQLGLEPTPEQYVENIVAVFREVRRVLAAHGTVWCNLGDSYGSGTSADRNPTSTQGPDVPASWSTRSQAPRNGLKPKDLVGIPWRVAFALQADGWYLRSDIVWSKPNPMPESVTDRPTKAHEYVFLLSKGPRYWFDQEAARERYEDGWKGRLDGSPASEGRIGGPGGFKAKGPDGRKRTAVVGANGSIQHRDGERWPNGGRNIRSVWEIATQPYSEAHFATFPEALVERCLKAGCPEWVCSVCGKPRERITKHEYEWYREKKERGFSRHSGHMGRGNTAENGHARKFTETLGWSDCGHGNYRPGRVLDPFMGSGTTALVARRLGRHAIGIELNEDYAAMCAKRLQQLSLLAEGTV